MTARVLRHATEPGPEGFLWRGLDFTQANGQPTVWITVSTDLGDRGAEWRVERVESSWHARLRIGRDRFPGVGKSALEALNAAEAEASNVATYIVAMLPAKQPAPAPRRSKRPRRAIQVRRA